MDVTLLLTIKSRSNAKRIYILIFVLLSFFYIEKIWSFFFFTSIGLVYKSIILFVKVPSSDIDSCSVHIKLKSDYCYTLSVNTTVV